MASHIKKKNTIYILGLPRKTLLELFNLFDKEHGTTEKQLHNIFGKPPYTFAVPEHIYEAAPLREFGSLKVSMKTRIQCYQALPDSLRYHIEAKHPSHIFGFFRDDQGRCYKQEEGDKWTVLVPHYIKKHDVDFPQVGEVILLRHCHKDDLTHDFVAYDIGQFKIASAVIYLR